MISPPRQPWLHDLVTVLCAPTVVLSDDDGQIRGDGAQGVWHADVRVLSAAEIRVDGEEPEPIASSSIDGTGAARFTGIVRSLGDGAVDPSVRVDRIRRVGVGLVEEEISVVSYTPTPVRTELVLELAADAARIETVKSGRSPTPIEIRAAQATDRVGLRWRDTIVEAELEADDAVLAADQGGSVRIAWNIELTGRDRKTVRWRLRAIAPGAAVVGVVEAEDEPCWSRPRVEAGDHRLPLLVEQSLADLAALRMRLSNGTDVFIGAGAPWFCTLYGRDSIWAARMLLPFGTTLAASTLRVLAGLQGHAVDDGTGEAPGKIPHALTGSDTTGGLPALYYGSVDATPLWVCLLHDAWRWGLPAAEVRPLLPHLEAALEWMVEHGDSDGDGFLEYVDVSGRGLANQGWKDSGDAIRFADGHQAVPPVALCEVQGYAYEAAMHGADLLAAFDRPGADRWREWAARLGERFRRRFWVSDRNGPYPALALDADKRQVDAPASNMGHLLGTGLLSAAETEQIAERLTGPDFDSGFGLRTMSHRAAAYSPLSYHCGSVWPHDTAIVIRGLVRSGHGERAGGLIEGLLAAGANFDGRLPELYGGDARTDTHRPIPYPAACRPQAWSAASAVTIVQALLGLDPDVPAGRIRLRPVRPSPVGALIVDGLAVGRHRFRVAVGADGEYDAPIDIPLDVDLW